MEGSGVAGPSKVRWAFDLNTIEQSFTTDTSDSPAEGSSSTLAFANAQLIAHGFVRSPGLQLDALSHREQDIAAKCLLAMLGQRMSDVSRSDELQTKLRTLSYDHERLTSLYKASQEKAANAEREEELAKSRMNAAQKQLSAEQGAHKQTSTTLQRAQAALQYGRSTAQNEIKKKEKEVEKYLERWSKISSQQAELGSVGSGLACANLGIVERGEGPKEDPLIEQALTDLESTKARLLSENDALRDVVLSAARGIQKLLHETDSSKDPPPLLAPSELFSPPNEKTNSLYDAASQALNAHSRMRSMISDVRIKIDYLQSQEMEYKKVKKNQGDRQTWEKEKERLAAELLDARQEAERLAEVATKAGSSKTLELQKRDTEAAKQVEEAAKRLRERELDLDREREEFSVAALRLGQEREALEAELKQLRDEKRLWSRRGRTSLAPVPDSPELRRELDIQNDLPQPSGSADPAPGRLHRVRRQRPSIEAAPEEAPGPLLDRKGKSRAVGFVEQVEVMKPRPSTTPPLPDPDEPTFEYVSQEEFQREIPHRAESTPAVVSRPRKSTNPFEEVLIRSSQRPQPVIRRDSLPTFRPAGTKVSPTSAGSSSEGSAESLGSSSSGSGDSGGKRSGRSPKKSKMRGSTAKASLATSSSRRGGDPTLITPPGIFTHRRVVGKKHQYAPIVPSPLSKMVKSAEDPDSSAEISKEGIGVQGDDPKMPSASGPNSISPTSNILAAGVRVNGTGTASAKPEKSLLNQGPMAALDLGGDGDVWVDDKPPSPPPRNNAPLTEEDLLPPTMMTLKKPPIRTIKPGGPSRPPPNATTTGFLRAKAVRPAQPAAQKENKPTPTSPAKKATVPVAAGVAKRPPVFKSAKTVPVAQGGKPVPKLGALRDRRKMEAGSSKAT